MLAYSCHFLLLFEKMLQSLNAGYLFACLLCTSKLVVALSRVSHLNQVSWSILAVVRLALCKLKSSSLESHNVVFISLA